MGFPNQQPQQGGQTPGSHLNVLLFTSVIVVGVVLWLILKQTGVL